MQQAVSSNDLQLSGLRKEYSEKQILTLLKLMILRVVNAVNIGKNMNENQIVQTAETILSRFWMLKLPDIKVCFENGLAGEYGGIYDRLDESVLCDWLNKYLDTRLDYSQSAKIKEHTDMKGLDNKTYKHIKRADEIGKIEQSKDHEARLTDYKNNLKK